MKKHLIVVAGGSGKRMESNIPKQFLLLDDKPVIMHTISAFYNYDQNLNIILVLPEEQFIYWSELCEKYNFSIPHQITAGGSERFFSVKNGLDLIKENGVVAIHDGVRPLVNKKTIAAVFAKAIETGNAVPYKDITESIRKVENDISAHVNRDEYKIIQTPQCFEVDLIQKAYRQGYIEKFTDDASVVENFGVKINLVQGNSENIKITNQSDLALALNLLKTVR